jgi:hypothetical protein
MLALSGFSVPHGFLDASGWQMAERASVRIAARESAQDQAMQQRYSVPQVFYNIPFAPVPLENIAPTPKRPLEVEDLPAPKAKKAKTKGKANADGTAGMCISEDLTVVPHY